MRAQTSLIAAAFAGIFLCASALAVQPVELRRDIRASGPALTLADVFVDAGAAGGRAVAPAPRPGESTNVSARFVSAAAAAAGLSWTPPDGMDKIMVSGRSGAATRRQYAALTQSAPAQAAPTSPADDAVIRRGDLVTLVYIAPGLQLTTRARAMADAGMGDAVRLVNLQSNRVVDATVTGPGAASANTGASF